jgi:ferredoxin
LFLLLSVSLKSYSASDVMNRCRSSTITRAKDKLCKDVISVPTREFVGSGETFKVTLLSKGESKTIECPDDMYILEAADKAGIDLPATCRGVFEWLLLSI